MGALDGVGGLSRLGRRKSKCGESAPSRRHKCRTPAVGTPTAGGGGSSWHGSAAALARGRGDSCGERGPRRRGHTASHARLRRCVGRGTHRTPRRVARCREAAPRFRSGRVANGSRRRTGRGCPTVPALSATGCGALGAGRPGRRRLGRSDQRAPTRRLGAHLRRHIDRLNMARLTAPPMGRPHGSLATRRRSALRGHQLR